MVAEPLVEVVELAFVEVVGAKLEDALLCVLLGAALDLSSAWRGEININMNRHASSVFNMDPP